MTNTAISVSQALQDIAKRLDQDIERVAGERVAFTLVVFTGLRAQYVSTAPREASIRELKALIEHMEAGNADVPEHRRN